MKIEGINLADVPVMSSANADDLALIVQQNGLRLQSYQNLTSTYYPISGSLKVPGVTLPLVQIATAQPTDELVLIVENNGLAVKQIGFAAPTMAVGSSIEVEGIALPSVRFSGTIDGDEYVIAVRENKLCLIPIPNSFSAGALPTAGRTMLANLTSSLILDEGTGGPSWSRATKAWGFNELGYLEELASGCAFFGGARLVRNLCTSNSDNFSAASLGGCSIVSAAVANHRGTNTAVKYLLENTAGSHYARLSNNAYAGMVILVSVVVKRDEHQYVAVTSGKSEAFDLTTNTWINAAQPETVARSFEVIDATWIRLTTSATIPKWTQYFGVAFANSLGSASWTPAGTENLTIADVSICDVTNYDASYVPEYVSVGVVPSPFFGAGIDGAKYFETDWQGAPIAAANLLGFRREAAATNNLLWSRDLSNAAWSTKTNITAAKTATGLDGIANSATTLTATAADAIILQPITLASAARCASAYVKRRTGTGTISFTQDGTNWTDITAQINSSTWSRVQITSTLANPSVGFKISTIGDEIDVDVVQNEAGEVATSPIVTTTATVTRNADSLSYQTAGNIDFAVGTIYGELQCSGSLVSRFAVEVGSATFQLSTPDANTDFRAYDTTLTAIKTGLSDITTGSRKRVVSWGPAGLSVTGDGLSPTTVAFDGSYGSGATVSIGRNINGYIGPVAIYNYKMTDAELQAITT